jgi:hypothetical protein
MPAAGAAGSALNICSASGGAQSAYRQSAYRRRSTGAAEVHHEIADELAVVRVVQIHCKGLQGGSKGAWAPVC